MRVASLCHAVALGKTSVALRESGVALSHGVPPPRSSTCAFSRAVFDSRSSFFAKLHGRTCYAGYGGPRERCRGSVKKKRIGRGPRERCRSVPRGGVKKKKGRGPREQFRSVRRGGVKEEKRKK